MLNVNEADIDRLTEAIYLLLKGETPTPIALAPGAPENEVTQLTQFINKFIEEYAQFTQAMAALARGNLEFEPPKGHLHALQSMKNLHANLRHLTWKTQQIAKGDFTQQIDFMHDFSTAFNGMTLQLKQAFERIEQQNQTLAEANRVIQEEKEKSDRLLLNVLPARVADELKQTGKTLPELFDDVTVLFSDFVGFTDMSAQIKPELLIDQLNELFTQFDSIIEDNGCERIKTIGDAYLAVCGMPAPNPVHCHNIVKAATEMVAWLKKRNAVSEFQWRIRIGIHTGPVVGAVVGVKKYIYDVFGDTINTASRMESHSEPMRINLSDSAYQRVKEAFLFEERPSCMVKGKGQMRMFFMAE